MDRMALELARTRLRGVYAIVAGVVLLVGLPLVEGFFLAPTGYLDAVAPAALRGDFGPLLTWTGRHESADLTFHLLEIVPFLLAALLPTVVRRALWRRESRVGLAAQLCGQAGFALFGLAVILGIASSASSGGAYLTVGSAAARSREAAGFASAYATQNVLSHVAGGALVTVFLLLVSVRTMRAGVLPRWLGYAGLVVAVLLGATAVQFLAGPEQVETPLSPVSFAALALWLITIGVMLARLRALPYMETATGEETQTDGAGTAPAGKETLTP